MGKLHVKGWGRKTNYLNGKVACQGLRVSQKQHGKNGPQRQPFYTTTSAFILFESMKNRKIV